MSEQKIIVFVGNNKVNKYMSELLGDSLRFFGFVLRLKSAKRATLKRVQKLFAGMDDYTLGFAIIDEKLWMNPEYKSFGNGQVYIWAEDLAEWLA